MKQLFSNKFSAFIQCVTLCGVLLLPAAAHAAPAVKKISKPVTTLQQPKIIQVQYDVKAASTGPFSDKLMWPQDAGSLVEVPSDGSITVMNTVAAGKTGSLKWAFVPVWSTAEPQIANMLSEAGAIAKKQLSKNQFKSKSKSEAYNITGKNIGKYLTVYSFVTNNDKFSVASFPLGIDYATAVTFLVVDAKDFMKQSEEADEKEEETPAPEESKKKEEPKPQPKPVETPKPEQKAVIPAPTLGTFSAYKLANSPSGAASKDSAQSVAKFQIKTTIASYLKSIKISVTGNLPKDKTKVIAVYKSEILTESNKLASATFGDIAADGTLTLTFKEQQAVYVSEPLILTIQANTTAANAQSWTQFNLLGGLTGVDKLEQFQSFAVGGGLVSYGGLPTDQTPPTTTATTTTPPVTEAQKPPVVESLAVTAVIAANSPSGPASKGMDQPIAKFVIKAPQNSGNKYAKLDGVTINSTTEGFEFSTEVRRYVKIYRTESLTPANLLGTTSLTLIQTAAGEYVQFDTPLTIEAGTYTILTITADTVDAKSNSVIAVELLSAKRLPWDEGGATVTDGLNVTGKKLFY